MKQDEMMWSEIRWDETQTKSDEMNGSTDEFEINAQPRGPDGK